MEAPSTVLEIPLAHILESKTNPRKDFSGLDELAASIKERGLLQPILVRTRPDSPEGGANPGYELIAGARRFRAAKLAGLTAISAISKPASDEEVLELQLIENSQRADVHPMEEAEAYEALLKRKPADTAYSDEAWLASRTGKKRVHVLRRLQLLALPKIVRKAYLAGVITLEVAQLIGRIPNAAQREEAAKEILEGDTYFGAGSSGPLESRGAKELIEDKYMTMLSEAKFDRADATLVPEAGACGPCPKRTGNDRDLFGDVVGGKDICTDATCFKVKTDTSWTRTAAKAKEAGHKVLSLSASKKVFGSYGNSHAGGEYVEADGRIDIGGKDVKVSCIAGIEKLQKMIVRHHKDDSVHELYDRATVKALYSGKKAQAAPSPEKAKSQAVKSKEEIAKQEARSELEENLCDEFMDRAILQVKKGKVKELALLRAIVSVECPWENVTEKAGFASVKVALARGKVNDLRALLIAAVFNNNSLDFEEVKKLAPDFGIDLKKLETELTAPQKKGGK